MVNGQGGVLVFLGLNNAETSPTHPENEVRMWVMKDLIKEPGDSADNLSEAADSWPGDI